MLGENVAKIRTDLMKEQLATFRSQLEDFARKHKVPPFYFQYDYYFPNLHTQKLIALKSGK